ncbi:MAG: AAA family ATPase [Ramlibacter sp.]
MTVAQWHDQLLDAALAWRAEHPEFRFNLRTTNVTGKDRLSAGYWFTGTDDYLFFAPFRPQDPLNKTRTIGFVVGFAGDGSPKRCSIEIVFGGTADLKQRSVYQKMLASLGSFKKYGKDKYKREYEEIDPAIAFKQFLTSDLPQLLDIIHAAKMEDRFLVTEPEFKRMLERVNAVRNGEPGPTQTSTITASDSRRLCLIGTWKGVNEEEAERVRDAIASKGAWASWWSFPIRGEFQDRLKGAFYVYLNAGAERIAYRMRVEKYNSAGGSEGIVSPWPAITDSDLVNKTRSGPKNSQIHKTWFYVTAFEEVAPSLKRDDFDPAEGVVWGAMLNQSAFGYAYRKSDAKLGIADAQTISAPVNLIVYGPPGTGKTHWLREKFKDYTDTPSNVDMDTWVQEVLTGYGWRSVIAAALNDFASSVRVPELREHRWIKAKTKQRGRTAASVQATLWGYLQEHTPEANTAVKVSVRRPPYIFSKRETGDWELVADWQELDDESAELYRLLKAGPKASKEEIRRYKVVTFHPSFSYEDFVRGIRPVATSDDGATQFRLVDGKFKQICDEAHANPGHRYALFIDEINRANVAKVFGELITLIEPDKRAVFDPDGRLVSGMAVHLPGGDSTEVAERAFGVPKNLDIFGTMNTADRSIALLDVALRRRFQFEEREPDYTKLDRSIGIVHLGKLLHRINDRLEYLLDRDHRVGHGYLMQVQTLAELRSSFSMQIVPLLQEYFFDDFSRVAMVLSTKGTAPLIAPERLVFGHLFVGQGTDGVPADRHRYSLTPISNWAAESFCGIYAGDGLESKGPAAP